MNKEKIVVYDYFNDATYFEGTRQECIDKLMDRVAPAKLFRCWQENDRYVYDFEGLFYTKSPLFNESAE